MAGIIKATSFDDLYSTMTKVERYIDNRFKRLLHRNKGSRIWDGYASWKAFLQDVEKQAIEQASIDLKLAFKTVKDRWKIMTLPLPFYCAIEDGGISFSKLKPVTSVNWDFNNPENNSLAKSIVKEIIEKKMSPKEIRALVAEKCKTVWNESHITVENIATQHRFNENSIC